MSLLNTSMFGVHQLPHANYASDVVLDELSRQLHASNTRRPSKVPASGQRVGTAMRITKPGSANNSPRSAVQSRRRTLIVDGPHGRFQNPPTQAPSTPQEPTYERESRPARPVSWHPTSHQFNNHQQPFPPQAVATNAFSQYADVDAYASYRQLPPTPTVYSAYTSPTSSFSPLSLAPSNNSSQSYFSPAHQPQPVPQASAPQRDLSPSHGSRVLSDMPYLPAPQVGGPLSWDAFAVHGFDGCSGPPTPEDFAQVPKAATKLATEDSIPYQPLEDDESEGEILYGMGLYDAPEKNSLLDFHRSTVFSLLGSGVAYPEPTGKGLKLEDAWEPPASDDEDDEEDGENDAEGEDA